MASDTSHPPSRLDPPSTACTHQTTDLGTPPHNNERHNHLKITKTKMTKTCKSPKTVLNQNIQHNSPGPIGEKNFTVRRTVSIESKITLFSAVLWQNMSRTPRRLSPPAIPGPGPPYPRSRRRRTFLSHIGTSSTRSCSATRPSSTEQQLRDFWHNQHLIQRN